MKIVPVIIDARPAYLRQLGAPPSLLLSTVGTQTLLQHACAQLQVVTDAPVMILTTFAAEPEYDAALRRTGLSADAITSIEHFDTTLGRLEPSDWLLIADPRHLPIDMASFRELARDLAEAREARHLVAIEASHQGTKEYLQLDGRGQVQRIQRYYDGVTWLQARAVAASLVPISAVRGFPSAAFRDLTALREALVKAGVVSRDIGLSAGAFDLNQQAGLVQLCESLLRGVIDGTPPPGFHEHVPGVWVGPGCRIDPTARFHGPIVLHEGVQLDAEVTLVGPTLLGAESRVRRGAILAQCLVAPGTVVPRQTTQQHCLLCSDGAAKPAPTGEAAREVHRNVLLKKLRVVLPGLPAGRRPNRRRRETYLTVKRVVDGVIALLGVLVLSPLIVLAATAIKLGSRGPVFFYHQREGKDGRPFRCCKFRTMVVGAHHQQRGLYGQNAVDGPQFKLHHDPRITRLGRWLRASNIDELPQLFNVLLGQMSLIGPRPSPFRENQICVPWREARLAVRPGITGLWQLCRQQRSAGDFHQWIHYDMLYVRHLSAWLDFKILLATLLTLGGRWSVPVRWLIPPDRLREEPESPTDRQHVTFTLQSQPINN